MRTRGTVIRLSGVVLCCWLSLASAQESQTSLVDRMEAVGMTVADMERSMAFYTNVLAFEYDAHGPIGRGAVKERP